MSKSENKSTNSTIDKAEFHKLIDNSLTNKVEDIKSREYRSLPRLVSYNSFTNEQQEYLYGFCTWCKSREDECLYIDYLKTFKDGKELYTRNVCTPCGFKLIDKESENRRLKKKNKWNENPCVKRLHDTQDKVCECCELCEHYTQTHQIIRNEFYANVCTKCAECFIKFY